MTSPQETTADHDVVVIGAGFAGLYAVHRANERGHRVLGIEAAHGPGGTWYWNRYPGARCDVESLDYSYSFDEQLQQEWRWSERYATQPEILRYIEHVADRFDLRRHYRFGERVLAASFDEASAQWTVRTDAGTVATTRHLICATGSLSAPHRPDIPGLDDFEGDVLMTANWPHEGVDLTGRRVAVIGTGSSGVQSVPLLAEQAESLVVFQRSPNFSVPAFNRSIPDDEYAEALRTYAERRAKSWASTAGSPHVGYDREALDLTPEERRAVFDEWWQRGGVLFAKAFPRQTIDPEINDLAREYAAEQVRSRVHDAQVAEDLIPNDHPIGTKRICTDSGYFETFNRDNVSLVNLRREPIETFVKWGAKTATSSYEFDTLVLATGFDALTGALTRMDVRGTDGVTMAERWADGPLTLLGLSVPGFPNLYNISGAGSPSVLANMVLTAEQHVDWVLDLIAHLDERGFRAAEAREDAAVAWTKHVDEVANGTLFTKANSWYMGANIEGKARGFIPYIGGFKTYIDHCESVRDGGYRGYVLSS
ncbi:flavin-containing monooxygenase [Nocardioides daejeonensis]|uniref:flavin-containing monooxygenase n=1 Tax=Nocardioides daejeonensis TaxID=1046556 RepID=UPI000D7422EB|nr:NAD(P)/FAD-dependent oxidoreductase [Nocardioides daejeonensis]